MTIVILASCQCCLIAESKSNDVESAPRIGPDPRILPVCAFKAAPIDIAIAGCCPANVEERPNDCAVLVMQAAISFTMSTADLPGRDRQLIDGTRSTAVNRPSRVSRPLRNDVPPMSKVMISSPCPRATGNVLVTALMQRMGRAIREPTPTLGPDSKRVPKQMQWRRKLGSRFYNRCAGENQFRCFPLLPNYLPVPIRPRGAFLG